MLKESTFPLVSIFAVCHGHEAYLIETLESIRNQSYPNIELIFINNLKDDCTQRVNEWSLKVDFPVKTVQNELPGNISKNWNLGLNLCHGKYFQGISCDDILHPEKISKQVQMIESEGETTACCFTDTIQIDENGLQIPDSGRSEWLRRKFGISEIDCSKMGLYLGWGVLISAPSVLLNREIVKGVGGYDEKYVWEDWQLWLKLAKGGFRFCYLPDNLVSVRLLSTSISRKKSSPEIQKEIAGMFMELFSLYHPIFGNDYYTTIRFSQKLVHILRLDPAGWVKANQLLLRHFSIPNQYLCLTITSLLHPIFYLFGKDALLFSGLEKLRKLFLKPGDLFPKDAR